MQREKGDQTGLRLWGGPVRVSWDTAALLTRYCWSRWYPTWSRGHCYPVHLLSLALVCTLLGCISIPSALPQPLHSGLSTSAGSSLPWDFSDPLSRPECTQECWPGLSHCLTTPHAHTLLGPLYVVVRNPHLYQLSETNQSVKTFSSA